MFLLHLLSIIEFHRILPNSTQGFTIKYSLTHRGPSVVVQILCGRVLVGLNKSASVLDV